MAIDVFDWVKRDRADLYQQMLDGKEIGFQKLAREYKAQNKSMNK